MHGCFAIKNAMSVLCRHGFFPLDELDKDQMLVWSSMMASKEHTQRLLLPDLCHGKLSAGQPEHYQRLSFCSQSAFLLAFC